MQLDKAIKSRTSTRRFKDKKPDWRDIIDAIDAARYAPMAGNLFSTKFILVSDPEKIAKLADCCQQPFVGDAHYVVVVCSDPGQTVNAFDKRGEIYCRQQAGAAIQNFILKLQEFKLSTCWTGHFVDDMIKRELRIPDNVIVEAVFPIGYASIEKGRKPKQKRKTELDRILYFDKWKEKRMKPLKGLEV